MIQMTSAEFAKANLTKIDDLVGISRYGKLLGTFTPASMAVEPQEGSKEGLKAAQERIEALEDEVKRLKRLLAAQAAPQATSSSVKLSSDPFSGLAPQDRAFFERKLGKKK
jgi:hypothetical protein